MSVCLCISLSLSLINSKYVRECVCVGVCLCVFVCGCVCGTWKEDYGCSSTLKMSERVRLCVCVCACVFVFDGVQARAPRYLGPLRYGRTPARGTDVPLGSGHTGGIEAVAVHLFRVLLPAPLRSGCIVALLRRPVGV